MQAGDVSTTVEVSRAQRPLLQTDSVTLGDVISSTSIDQLPLATNNFTQLLALVARRRQAPSTIRPAWAAARRTIT